MKTLHLLLDDALWSDVCREAAARSVDADALMAHVLSTQFTCWLTPDAPVDAGDPILRLRLALAAYEAVDEGITPQFERMAVMLGQLAPDPASGADRLDPWAGALEAAIADDARDRVERLERWQAVFRAAERARRRHLHREAVDRFAEAAALVDDSPIPLMLTLERLARTELVLGSPDAAAGHARRALQLARLREMPLVEDLIDLVEVVEAVADGHPAVQQIVAGLVALDQQDPGAATERLAAGAAVARESGRSDYEMRARGALAVVRLALGAGRAAGVEARRAAELARSAALDDLGGLLEVLANAGETIVPEGRAGDAEAPEAAAAPEEAGLCEAVSPGARDRRRSGRSDREPRCG